MKVRKKHYKKALKLLKKHKQILIAPYGLMQPNTDNYLFIISDSRGTKHYFYEDGDGKLVYDGWLMKEKYSSIKTLSEN